MRKKESPVLKHIGSKIKELRKRNGISQDELSILINITRAQLSNIETGRCGTTADMIYNIAYFFQTPISELYPSFDTYKPEYTIPNQ